MATLRWATTACRFSGSFFQWNNIKVQHESVRCVSSWLMRSPLADGSHRPTDRGVVNAMSGAVRGFANHRHKRLLKHAKGYRGRSKNCFVIAIRRVEKAWQYAYRDRKVKKRLWRTLWIQRLSGAARQYQMRYSQLICGLNHATVPLNRKVLSELAATEPFAFKAVVDVIKYQQAEHDAQKKLLQQSSS